MISFDYDNTPEGFKSLYFESQNVTQIANWCEVPEKPNVVGKGKIRVIVKNEILFEDGKKATSVLYRVNDKGELVDYVETEIEGLVCWSDNDDSEKVHETFCNAWDETLAKNSE